MGSIIPRTSEEWGRLLGKHPNDPLTIADIIDCPVPEPNILKKVYHKRSTTHTSTWAKLVEVRFFDQFTPRHIRPMLSEIYGILTDVTPVKLDSYTQALRKKDPVAYEDGLDKAFTAWVQPVVSDMLRAITSDSRFGRGLSFASIRLKHLGEGDLVPDCWLGIWQEANNYTLRDDNGVLTSRIAYALGETKMAMNWGFQRISAALGTGFPGYKRILKVDQNPLRQVATYSYLGKTPWNFICTDHEVVIGRTYHVWPSKGEAQAYDDIYPRKSLNTYLGSEIMSVSWSQRRCDDQLSALEAILALAVMSFDGRYRKMADRLELGRLNEWTEIHDNGRIKYQHPITGAIASALPEGAHVCEY
ncbi:hypothetical protein JX265_008459 [Neoarthrinium moseri]|uniref:Uncharacterized protein n=1 Tax=Neoarthrinium moseri TaxID=1658444 RepID=A0A9Q0ANR3_9PEZI|nr:hypothetical protein JX266_010161 [Neoarthrinium moseri]KAI1864735.1 hypothetical protein JX265_008459 [Neoarthrinium moseri]